MSEETNPNPTTHCYSCEMGIAHLCGNDDLDMRYMECLTKAGTYRRHYRTTDDRNSLESWLWWEARGQALNMERRARDNNKGE